MGAKKLALISASGGAGKTTLALLLTYYLIRSKQVEHDKVLLIDLDPTAGLSLRLLGEDGYLRSNNSKRTLMEMYDEYRKGNNINIMDYTVSILHIKEYWNLKINVLDEFLRIKILPPGEELDRLVYDLSSSLDSSLLLKMLQSAGLESNFNYVIIDTAPFFDKRYTFMAIHVADAFVVPLKPTVVDLRRNIRMMKEVRRILGDTKNKAYFVFNYSSTLYRTETDILSKLNVTTRNEKGEPKSKSNQESSTQGSSKLKNEELVSLINELHEYGKVVPEAIGYFKEISDAEFPQRSKGGKTNITDAPCGAINYLLKNIFGVSIDCPYEIEYEA